MKVILLILLALFLLTGCDEKSSFYDLISDKIHSLKVKVISEELSMENLVERDGLMYKINEAPFTGKVNGSAVGRYKSGIREGEWIWYYKNGQLRTKANFIEGKADGEYLSYYENGQLHEKKNYTAGWSDGEYKSYYENGQLEHEGNYKARKLDGEWEHYHENGQLEKIEVYLDGELQKTIYP